MSRECCWYLGLVIFLSGCGLPRYSLTGVKVGAVLPAAQNGSASPQSDVTALTVPSVPAPSGSSSSPSSETDALTSAAQKDQQETEAEQMAKAQKDAQMEKTLVAQMNAEIMADNAAAAAEKADVYKAASAAIAQEIQVQVANIISCSASGNGEGVSLWENVIGPSMNYAAGLVRDAAVNAVVSLHAANRKAIIAKYTQAAQTNLGARGN